MLARLAVVVVCVAACNQAFGIFEAEGPDSDGDGIPDDRDNCPLVPNPDQADRDHDGLGDACDPCPDGPQTGTDNDHDGVDDGCDPCLTGANTDEDGDGFLDGCDVCPGEPDDQTDSDGDGVGDACDLEPGVINHRVFFDGFNPPQPGWNTGFQVWQAVNGDFGPVPGSQPPAVIGVWNPAATVTGAHVHVEIAVAMPATSTDGDQVGISVVSTIGEQQSDCEAEYARFVGPGWLFEAGPSVISYVPEARFVFRHGPTGAHVSLINGTAFPPQHNVDVDTAIPELLSEDSAIAFHWIDVVE